MNLLAQNLPRQALPGRVVAKLYDDAPDTATRFQAWYADNRASVLTRVRQRHEAKRDAINARRRELYAANPDKYRKQAAVAYKRHATKIKARVAARAARLKASCAPG